MKRKLNPVLVISYIVLAASLILLAVLLVDRFASAPAVPSDTETAEVDPKYYEDFYIVLQDSDNPTLPFSVNSYFDEEGICRFFLPSGVDVSALEMRVFSREGEQIAKLTESFKPNVRKTVKFAQNTVKVEVMQTDLPSMSITLCDDSPKLFDIAADKYKTVTGNGDMSLFVPAGAAKEYGCKQTFTADDGDDSVPGAVTIKGRGHSSWLYPDKKGFSLKLESGAKLLGMSKAKSWALIANHYDRSLVRNMIISDISSALGFYTEYRCVELYVDGDYQGTYTLTGKIKIDGDRIDITDLEKKNETLTGENYVPKKSATEELECGATVKYWKDVKSPEDVTGGYIIEVDIASRAKKGNSYILTKRGISYMIESPEYVSYEEGVYLAEFLQGFEDAVYSPTGKNEQGRSVSDYADIKTLALRYLVDEMCRNPDSGETSTFFYKDSDSVNGLLYSGPLWDYDLALGNYQGYRDTEGYEARKRFYYPELFKYREFTDALYEYYGTVKSLFEEEINGRIDEHSAYLKKSADMNFARWNCMNTTIKVAPADAAKSYTQAKDYIKDFLKKRIKWLDGDLYKELSAKR